MVKVSIIIPVYNVEKYLSKCLDSVVNQTFKDIEIICVNDGSTDNSLNILEKYAQKDSRIKIINKDNGGISSARNYGLDNAIGDYCYFIDSDDWIELNTIEILLDKMQNNNVDCVVHRVINIPEDDHCKELAQNCQEWFDCKNKSDGVYDVPININNEIAAVAWNKLYKMSIIKEYDCCFPEGLINEDEAFIWIYMIHCKKYYFTNEKLYNYLRRSNSIMGTRDNSPKVLDILKIQKLIFETVKKYKNIENYKEVLTNNYINELLWLWKRMPKQYRKDVLKLIKDYICNTNNDKCVKKTYTKLKYKNLKLFMQGIFSIRNIKNDNYVGKQIKICGIKIKFKNKYKTLLNTNIEDIQSVPEKTQIVLTDYIKDLINSEIAKNSNNVGCFNTNNNDENILNHLKDLNKFYFLPNKGNLGDIVIASSEYQYFDANKFDYKIYDILQEEKCTEPFNFVYGGGGIWHKFYQQDYQEIIKIFQNSLLKKCVVLPSSFYDCEDAINTFDERFTVFCREKQSYEYCTSLNRRAKFILADDMVINADLEMYNMKFSNFEQSKTFVDNLDFNSIQKYIGLYIKYDSEKLKVLEKPKTIEDFSVGYMLREDKEKNNQLSDSTVSIDLSSYLGGYGCDKAYSYICSKLFLEIINKFNIIVTDRLHVGICATKLEKKVLLLDNSYKKLSEVYKQSLCKFDNVRLTTIENLDNDIEELKQNMLNKTNNNNYLVNSFIDFITQYSCFKNEYGIERRFW